jgi:membrane protease YdiL (CAAX protease family)
VRARSALGILAGCALLLARPLLRNGPAPVASLTVAYVVLLIASTASRQIFPRYAPENLPRTGGLALGVGLAAFGVGRLVVGGRPSPWVADALALDALAAVAEEAFFRRFVYDALLPAGDVAAGIGAAVLFALVHVPVYGWWVVPLDLAAGLVLSWQRAATGSWGVPAATHVAANVIMRL